MKVAILGYGVEGKSAEEYFEKHDADVTVFEPFDGTDDEIVELNDFDLVMRSPSIPPKGDWSSSTKYFFEHCPCPIIGVTGTKGKGTTCSLIASILKELGHKVWLVGNIGKSALDILDQVHPSDIVIYEMSSFQLWDMKQSPHFAVVLRIEPDHLNIHKDYNDYVDAKSHITAYQAINDFCVYHQGDSDSTKIAKRSAGTKIPYPFSNQEYQIVKPVLQYLSIVGPHNLENAEAALAIVAAFEGLSLIKLIQQYHAQISKGLNEFHGLPHRLELVRNLKGVSYYDDNFATNISSLDVALKSFPNTPIILIAGGRDKTANADLPKIAKILQTTPNIQRIILIGESGHDLFEQYQFANAEIQDSLIDAVESAQKQAEACANSQTTPIVLMSPAAASFDMFKNVYDRGDQYQKIVQGLK